MNEEFIYRAMVIDDETVSNVNLDIENGEYQAQMFDDGMHNDSLANDNIFGNSFPMLSPTSGTLYGDSYQIEVNNISLPFNEKGVLADINIGSYQLPAELRMIDNRNNILTKNQNISIPLQNLGSGGKYGEGTFLFSGGFWLSGYSNGEMWSNAVASATLVEDYLAGKVGSDPGESINRIYIVNKDHLPFGSAWQNWKDAVYLGAEFYDGDDDGIYNPVDKNWNGTWDLNEDMPPLIGDEIAWCVYNDALPKNVRRWNTISPQGIEVRQTIFGSDDPELENVILIRYSILNTGLVADVMDSVYFGIWQDGDLGDYTDDVVGCDTLLNSAFYYEDGPDNVYGDNPLAFFSTFLQGPITFTNNPSDTAKNIFGQQIGAVIYPDSKILNITSHIFYIGGDPNLNDPSTAVEARNYIVGKDRLGNYPNPCTFTYGQVHGGVNCNDVDPKYWFSGDPVIDVGWICTQNQDMKNLISTGPFLLEKDKPQEIIIAYVIGR